MCLGRQVGTSPSDGRFKWSASYSQKDRQPSHFIGVPSGPGLSSQKGSNLEFSNDLQKILDMTKRKMTFKIKTLN